MLSVLMHSLTLFLFWAQRYAGYGKEQRHYSMSAKKESLMSFFSLVQSVLLGSFAAILGAHRSEILDKNSLEQGASVDSSEANHTASQYDPPSTQA
jgi:hypothetical protein